MSGLLDGTQLIRVSNAWRRTLRADPVLSRQSFPDLGPFAAAFNDFLTGDDEGVLAEACDEFTRQGLQPEVVIRSVTILAETVFDEYGMESGAVTKSLVASLGYVCARLTFTMVATEADVARRDPDTGLENRRALTERLRAVLPGGVALVFADLDGLKQVNDTRGHAAGDDYLRKFAADLRSSLPEGATAYRVGGDEFVALCPKAPVATVRQIFKRLMEDPAIAPFSYGIAVGPDDADSPNALIDLADAAQYEMKRAHKAGSAESPSSEEIVAIEAAAADDEEVGSGHTDPSQAAGGGEPTASEGAVSPES